MRLGGRAGGCGGGAPAGVDSWLLGVALAFFACGDAETGTMVLVPDDLGQDGGRTDAGPRDLGPEDAGPDMSPDLGGDAGPRDLGADEGPPDLGAMDAGPDMPDLGPPPPPPVCADRRMGVPLAGSGAPDRMVGTGTPGSCTETALRDAVALGGRIAFDCGEPATRLTLTEPLRFDVSSPDVVLDGGGTVTLDGGGRVRLMVMFGLDAATPAVTLKDLTFEGGRAPTMGDDRGRSGGAILHGGGPLVIEGCTFSGNEAGLSGPDVAGGAISNQGNVPTFIVDSTFTNNRAGNGGALGTLATPLVIIGSRFEDNVATGRGGFGGTGGSGGALYGDGPNRNWSLCGVDMRRNEAGAFGGAVFRVAQTAGGATRIERSVFADNVALTSELSQGGALYLEGSDITVDECAIADNEARSGGGLWVGGRSATLNMRNTMIVGNVADGSLGGGLNVFGGVAGTLTHVTFAANEARGELNFAGALAGGGMLRLEGCLVADQRVGNGFNPISCFPSAPWTAAATCSGPWRVPGRVPTTRTRSARWEPRWTTRTSVRSRPEVGRTAPSCCAHRGRPRSSPSAARVPRRTFSASRAALRARRAPWNEAPAPESAEASGKFGGPEEERDLDGRVLLAVRAVDGVLTDVLGEGLADGALVGVRRIRGSHHLAVGGDGVLALENADDHRAPAHELRELTEEGALLVHRVEGLGLRLAEVHHLHRDDLQALLLDHRENLADVVPLGGVGLDDAEGAFDGHVVLSGRRRPRRDASLSVAGAGARPPAHAAHVPRHGRRLGCGK